MVRLRKMDEYAGADNRSVKGSVTGCFVQTARGELFVLNPNWAPYTDRPQFKAVDFSTGSGARLAVDVEEIACFQQVCGEVAGRSCKLGGNGPESCQSSVAQVDFRLRKPELILLAAAGCASFGDRHKALFELRQDLHESPGVWLQIDLGGLVRCGIHILHLLLGSRRSLGRRLFGNGIEGQMKNGRRGIAWTQD